MSGYNFIVPPRSWAVIESITVQWRESFHLSEVADFPIMDFIEKVLDNKLGWLTLEVEGQQLMGAAEGYTDPNGKFIMLREDVYRGANAGNARDRFTAAHELGHWALHTKVPLARATPEQNIKPFRLSEPQANVFASALLMPRRFFSRSDDEDDVMSRHGVGFQAARNRLEYLRRNGLL